MFCAKIKILKFETKNVSLGIFRLRIGEKMVAIFGISTLKFVEMQKIVQNKRNNFQTSDALFGYFKLLV